ncbi:uncharacterized protein LOC113464881 [Ceratina calcarata]|uniref:Uncharacterized protein LOC113464881 n=1 Tax=Ceratina calcarata TaxID=156304 RepID=A0AAJ7S9J4_9HYME|nr:uncharacterized protein LOC113464881 [Ceratina calcarata]
MNTIPEAIINTIEPESEFNRVPEPEEPEPEVPSTSRADEIVIEHPTTERVRDTLLRGVGVAHSVDLTPKARSLYKHARKIRNKLCTYKMRPLSFKNRLKLAEKQYNFPETNLRKL